MYAICERKYESLKVTSRQRWCYMHFNFDSFIVFAAAEPSAAALSVSESIVL